jgi:hypothetical protein
MVATVNDVRNCDFTGELDCVDDDRIACILAHEVPCYINAEQFCDCAAKAEALVAAHIIPVTAESAGGLSRSYGTVGSASGSAGFWQSTTFGQRYWAIASSRITSPIVLCADGVAGYVA